jgi:ArsR family metal-binding transcriptional regulator
MNKGELLGLLFKGIHLEKFEVVDRSPCLADPERFKIIAKTNKNLEGLLPILFLAVPNARYSESSKTMSYSFDRHNVVVGYNGEVAVTFIKDDDELKDLTKKITDLLNRGLAYQASHPKVPNNLLEEKKRLSPMAIHKKLPQTNCKECGESGCYAFASKLYIGEKNVEGCPYVDAAGMRKLLQPITLQD